jgi:hypothetical protein
MSFFQAPCRSAAFCAIPTMVQPYANASPTPAVTTSASSQPSNASYGNAHVSSKSTFCSPRSCNSYSITRHCLSCPRAPSPTLAHPTNSLDLTSPPSTPSTPALPGSNRLDAGSRAFIPRSAAKVTVKKPDGTEVSLENLTKSTPTPSTPTVSSPQTSTIR